MIPWELLDSAPVPGSSSELSLYRRGHEYSIRVDGRELMNNQAYGSEDALAEQACPLVGNRTRPRVLIGGLGMGYTLAATLRCLGPDASVLVAELVPAVVAWNRGVLADLANRPLFDPRVTVFEGDVGELFKGSPAAFDAVLLDVDNGPEGLTRAANDRIYATAGLRSARRALKPDGVLAVWSAGPDQAFVKRLRASGFRVQEITARGRGARGGTHYTVWLARPV